MLTLDAFEEAAAKVKEVTQETKLIESPYFSEISRNRVFFKPENMQRTGAYKVRGAYYKISTLTDEERAHGLITASAGNHAQGVAYAAQHYGVKATIVMPTTTPLIKVERTKALGADVVLAGNVYDEAYEHALKLAEENSYTFIHPFNDLGVATGQGTIAMEIVQELPLVDTILVPVGGGLACGVSTFAKLHNPKIRVIGVEPVDSDAMRRSIMAGHRVELKDVGLFADGVAVKLVGEETFALCRDLLDDIITVDTDAICGAIKDIFEDTRVVAEPAGALALAGLRAYARAGNLRDTTLVAVVSGANMNFDRLSHVAERARFGANREALLGVTIPEKAGSFRQLVQAISSRNITELCTRFADPVNAHVLVGIDIKNSDEVASVLDDLRAAGFSACDLTDNELAKLHLRHMVGGNAPQVHNERLIRFFFPERPGALLNFMDAMRVTYNFTLFQYRYHGADFGRVLLGVEVPDERREDFEEFLTRVDRMGYPHVDETDNPAYKMFLGWHHDD